MEPHHSVRDLGEVADAQAAAAPWTETHMLQEVIQYGKEVGYLDCSCSPSEDRTLAPVSQSGYLAAVVLDFLSSSLLPSLCLSSNSKPRSSSSSPLFPSQASQPAPPSLPLPLSADAHSLLPSSSAALFIAALRQQSLSFAVSLLICAVCVCMYFLLLYHSTVGAVVAQSWPQGGSKKMAMTSRLLGVSIWCLCSPWFSVRFIPLMYLKELNSTLPIRQSAIFFTPVAT